MSIEISINRKWNLTLCCLLLLTTTGCQCSEKYLIRDKQVTEQSMISEIVSDLKNGNEVARYEAAHKLGKLKECPPYVIDELIIALDDSSREVRIHAVSALGKLKAEKAVTPLIKLLENGDAEIILFTIQALGDIGPKAERAVPVLQELINNKNICIRAAAAMALGKIGSKGEEAVPIMIEDLKSEDKYNRIRAANALKEIGYKSKLAIPALKVLLKDPEFSVRQSACRALRAIQCPDAWEVLKNYKEDCYNITIRHGKKFSIYAYKTMSLYYEFNRDNSGEINEIHIFHKNLSDGLIASLIKNTEDEVFEYTFNGERHPLKKPIQEFKTDNSILSIIHEIAKSEYQKYEGSWDAP